MHQLAIAGSFMLPAALAPALATAAEPDPPYVMRDHHHCEQLLCPLPEGAVS
jgi:hypothetical protein